jgi:lysine 2,3-aminomutase
MTLMHKLVKNRVRPYYIYQCDLVHGAGHFRTPVAKGIEIMEALRGHTSGFAIPTFVIDAPEGGGKVPLLPNYMLSMSDSRVVVRNYEGLISTYVQPTEYQPHDPATCAFCQSKREEGGQDGVASLLSGRNLTIAPEGWRGLHQRATAPQITFAQAPVPQNGRNGYASNGSQHLQSARFRNGRASREPDDKR